MTGFRLIYDDGEARLIIDNTIARLRNLGPIMAAIAGEVDDRVQEAFEHKTDPVDLSKWPELSVATAADRARKGFNISDILQRTGILRSSVITDSDDHGVTSRTRGVDYALIHFEGAPGANIPARRFAGASLDDIELFEDMIARFIVE